MANDLIWEDNVCNIQNLTFSLTANIFADKCRNFDFSIFKTSQGAYTNLGLLFSDNCPVIIKTASFSGDFGTALKSRNEFMGPVIMQIDQCTNYVIGMLPGTTYLTGIQRQYISAVPVVALKETIANAVINKNYAGYSSPVTVSVCSDKVIVTSVVSSASHNPKLREIFSHLGYIAENNSITGQCYSKYNVKPEFVFTKDVFTATLPFIPLDVFSV